jgi:hypothetical protein
VEIVWEVVGEDLCIATGDNQDGLCLEESDYDSDGNYLQEGMYERMAWGFALSVSLYANGLPPAGLMLREFDERRWTVDSIGEQTNLQPHRSN